MSDSGVVKRLAAILAADIAGYTRLMEVDSDGTVAAWKAARLDVIDPSIAKYSGRIVKHTGDGFLAEFATVQSGVECAVALQKGLETSSLEFRMGVNLGDIIDDGQDIHGEGVNIAARIEALAEPGGISISGGAFEQVRNRLDCKFEDTGEHEVKHVSAPVRVYRIRTSQSEAFVDEVTKSVPTHKTEKLELPDKPSIAVLPFVNMSGDPEQEYFVDGIVEDILTTLSKIPKLFVIARNSSFKYKGQSPDLRDVGRDLGVKYVVEGSVRKAGNKVRVTAQLIDARDGQHIWADNYDGELDDVFELQDRITKEIVTRLEVNLTDGQQVAIWRERSGTPLVYEKFIKGRDLYTQFSRQSHIMARHELEKALEISPSFSPAIVILGFALADLARFGWIEDRQAGFDAALDLAERALKVDPDFGMLYSIQAYTYTFLQRHDEAIVMAEKAVVLSPNDATAFHTSAITHIYAGNYRRGRDYELQSRRLSPLDMDVSLIDYARAQFHLKEYDDAIEISKLVLLSKPDWLTAKTILLSSLWRAGQEDEAKAIAAKIIAEHPKFSAGRWSSGFPYRNDDDRIDLMAPLRETGLPE